jgi:hypothetical protein
VKLKYLEKDHRLKFNIDEVLFVDTERKNLPFKQASSCKVITVQDWKTYLGVMKAGCGLVDLSGKPDKAEFYDPIKVVIVDSFTRILFLLSEFLHEHKIKGYDFWREFADTIERLLMTWQSQGRFIIFTALDEAVRDNDSVDRVVVKIDGKRLEGKVESYFTICLHTHFNVLKAHPEGYQFCTNTDGRNTAKSPEGMFEERYIQNDMAYVLGRIYEYYDMANNPDFLPSPIIVCGKSGTGKSSSFRYLIKEATDKQNSTHHSQIKSKEKRNA